MFCIFRQTMQNPACGKHPGIKPDKVGRSNSPLLLYLRQKGVVMELVRHELRLNILEVGNQGTVNVRQGDKDTHLLVVRLVKGSLPYLLPEDGSVIVVVCAEKPDGTFIVDSPASVVEGAVHYFMDEQFFTATGIAKCELVVYSETGEILYSPHFSTYTEKTSVDVEKVESKDEFRAFDQAMSDARTITNKWNNPSATVESGPESNVAVTLEDDGVHFDFHLDVSDFVTIDGEPTAGSPNAVSSGGVYDFVRYGYTPVERFLGLNSTVEDLKIFKVPIARTINSKPLSADVLLSAADVGAPTEAQHQSLSERVGFLEEHGTGGGEEPPSDEAVVGALVEYDLIVSVIDDAGNVLADENGNIFEW